MPDAARTSSPIGQYLMPSPYGRQRDRRIPAPSELRAVRAATELLDQLLERLETQLLEPVGLAPGERLAGQVAQGGPDQTARVASSRARASAAESEPSASRACLRPRSNRDGVELVIGDREPVAGRRGREPIGIRAERVTQTRDVDLARLDRAEGLVVGPQSVGQQLGRDRLVPLEEQDREHAPLACAAQIERASIGQDRDVPE